jgi:predicted hydrocarbon binding protein
MIEKTIDDAWMMLLAAAMKRRETARPQTGDFVDIYIPQARILSLAQSNPAVPRLLYLSAQSSAKRNAYIIVRKLGMPADYFWKFEYWTEKRARDTLSNVLNKIFSAIMQETKQGVLQMQGLQIDPLKITLEFADCTECSGFERIGRAICVYHAGLFSGILSALLSRDLDAWETACCAQGESACRFEIAERSNRSAAMAFEQYVSQKGLELDLVSRLEKSLEARQARGMGNYVDVNYLRLVTGSILQANPQLFAPASRNAGATLGHKVAPVLPKRYGEQGLAGIARLYSQLRHSIIDVEESGGNIKFTIRECAESPGAAPEEMLSFLIGELQGLVSEIKGGPVAVKEKVFEPGRLILVFGPQV